MKDKEKLGQIRIFPDNLPKVWAREQVFPLNQHGTTCIPFQEFYISICFLLGVAQTPPGSHLLILCSPESI